jgi:rhodanese-related sulfurtransferase
MKMLTPVSRLLPLFALLLVAAPVLGQAPATIGQRMPVPGGAYWEITVPQLQTMLANKDFPLVNVHVPFAGDLPRTDLSVPFDEILAHLAELPADKNAPVVLYCQSGPMGMRAATALAGQGYTRIYNLQGGFRAWVAAGLPLATP